MKPDDAKVWEFSKKLTFVFVLMCAIHLTAHLVSAMFVLGDYKLIKESFIGALPFYITALATYMGKSTLDNFDKSKNKKEITLKQIDCNESNG